MKNKQLINSILLIVGFALAFYLLNIFLTKVHQSAVPKSTLTIDGTKVNIEIVTTKADQELGLSGRTSLKEDAGMLFVFAKPGRYDFWMKDMNFPLDMIWFGTNNKVIYIKKNALPESYPNAFGPTVFSSYVLEVNSGFADQHNIKIGDTAVLSITQ